MSELLRTQELTKRFGLVTALDRVNLGVAAGEIHALLGENGAGKTTLLRLLFGLERPDAGTIRWRGRPVAPASPRDARALGIGMVHQHFMLVEALTVWENLWLSHPGRPRFHLDRHAARRAVGDLSDRFELGLDPDAIVRDLPVGGRQRLEIAKALARDVDLLILDEPTAVLAPGEVDDLFRALGELRAAGTSVLFVTHKLREVVRLSDRITVLRHGRVTSECATADADVPSLTRSVVGDAATEWARMPVRRVTALKEESDDEAPGVKRQPGRTRLEVLGLSGGRPGRVAVRDLSFTLRAGEILGVTGVEGNGQGELVALLAGVTKGEAGRIRLRGENVTEAGVRERWRRGLAVLPGDRGRNGLVGSAPVWENLALRDFGARWARRVGWVVPDRHRARAAELIGSHDLRAAEVETPARHLSGGNQQKLLLARELAADVSVMVLLNPTRGLDVGAADSLLRELLQLREDGAAVLLVSTELDEVLRVADRVAVLANGRWHEAPGGDREAIGALMLGGAPS